MGRLINESVGTSLFEDNFKNAVRDYYTYGFKTFEQFEKSSQTLKKNWEVLNKILGENWTLEKGKKGSNRISLKTFANRTDDPVNELYCFHNLSRQGHFLNYLLELDSKAHLRSGLASIQTKEEELTDNGRLQESNEMEYIIIQNWISDMAGGAASREEEPVRVNRELEVFCPSGYSNLGDKYKGLQSRLVILEAYGILYNLKYDQEKRNAWLKSECSRYPLEEGVKRYFGQAPGGSAGRDYWKKSPLSMEALVNYGKSMYEKPSDFLRSFADLCRFFSQYHTLGEIGYFLRMRLRGGAELPETPEYAGGPFRFKHNYIQKPLYDYNLLDILNAIEHAYICQVEYAHGTNLNKQESLMVPLEVRISVTNGREYVMYYDIVQGQIRALRLEFIDKIVLYKDVTEVWRTDETGIPQKIEIDPAKIESQTAQAKEMLPFIWGTEVRDCVVDGDWPKRLKTYKIHVGYDSGKEQFIQARIQKESRKLSDIQKDQTIVIRCFPTKELRPWVRSFYVRLGKTEGLEEDGFCVSDDVSGMYDLYCGGGSLKYQAPVPKAAGKRQPFPSFRVEGRTVSILEGHGALFHELFSKYGIVLANSVLKCSKKVSGDIREILTEELGRAFSYYTEDELEEAAETLAGYAEDAGVIGQDGQARFITEKTDYLYELLPLTKVECRWLLTVLRDPMAEIFFSKETIGKLAEYIRQTAPFEVRPFPVEAITYFDRYNKTTRTADEIEAAKIIYQGICEQNKIQVKYRNWKGDELCSIIRPACLEYSRRDDILRVWDLLPDGQKIRKINIPRVFQAAPLKEHYDLWEIQRQVEKRFQDTITHLEIEFYEGNRNLPDRLLTEFSLWEKKCIYDPATQKFTMALTYSALDEKEVLVRLLSYGAYIKVSEAPGNYVYEELKRRIAAQSDREFAYAEDQKNK